MTEITEISSSTKLCCKNCGKNDCVEILSRGKARKNGFNDTGRTICYGKCRLCGAVYMIHIPSKKYNMLHTR